jgi:hypothetical protein
MEEKLQLVQRTLRDFVRFNTDNEDLNLDFAFILASNDDELIDEIRKMYYFYLKLHQKLFDQYYQNLFVNLFVNLFLDLFLDLFLE